MILPSLIAKAASLLAPIASKLASPAVKWSLIAAAFVFSNVCSIIYTWHHTSMQCEQSKAEAIALQVREYESKSVQITESREDVLRQRNDAERLLNDRIVDLQRRLVTYERNAKKTNVPVPPDSVRVFNAISGLLPAQNIVPGTDPSTGKPYESPEARIEVTRLLLAYVRAYADCGGELATLWQDYEALVQSIRNEYTIQKGDQ